VLPLRKDLGTIAVIGPDAADAEILLGNYNGVPSAPVTPLEGIRHAVSGRTQVLYARGSEVAENTPSFEAVPASALAGLRAEYFANQGFSGEPFAARAEPAPDHTWWLAPPLPGMPEDNFSVRWTGTLQAPASGHYALGLRTLGGARLFLDDSLVVSLSDRHVIATDGIGVDLVAGMPKRLRVEYFDRRPDAMVQLVWAPPRPNLREEALAAARRADAVVMVLGLSPRLEGEEMPVRVPGFAGGDRTSLDLPSAQEELLEAVVGTGKPVVLVLLNGSALAVNWAAEHVPAIVDAWYPGQAAGTALADVLFGDVNPAGRLPVTFYRSVDQLPPFADYGMEGRTYKYFRGDALFPFGHGLSYTRFRYRDLRAPAQVRAGESAQVSVEVENAGGQAGEEVVQLYVSAVDPTMPAPIRSLEAFRRIALRPGERQRVAFTLTPRQLSIVDPQGRWVEPSGAVSISVGGKQPGFHGNADAATTEVVTARVQVVR
jgi:beta-glucosidase